MVSNFVCYFAVKLKWVHRVKVSITHLYLLDTNKIK